MKVGIYCRPCVQEPDANKQQQQLEKYITKQGWELTNAYFDNSDGVFSLKNNVQLAMLQAANQKQFDLLLVTDFAVFPTIPKNNLPPLVLYMLNEQKTISIGTTAANLQGTSLETTPHVSIYPPIGQRLY